jgi:hypothetical protein
METRHHHGAMPNSAAHAAKAAAHAAPKPRQLVGDGGAHDLGQVVLNIPAQVLDQPTHIGSQSGVTLYIDVGPFTAQTLA